MRLVTFAAEGREPRLGCVRDGRVIDLADASGQQLPSTLIDLVVAGEDAWWLARVITEAEGVGSTPFNDMTLLAPIPVPRKNVFCVGRNYVEHVKEGAAARQSEPELPKVPVFFTKAPTSVIGSDAPIPFPSGTERLDWEAELAVVIGRRGRDIKAADAHHYVFGYTAANDLSARDLQFGHTQWFKGKSLDATCPLGPWVVTSDEIPDPQGLEIECRVNGVVKQKSNTSRMIFDIATVIESLSLGLTLEPGDIILTGTPEGVGFARTPAEFLWPDDVVEVEIERIGVLRNRIVEAEPAHG